MPSEKLPTKIRIVAPARLHFGLIDLSGANRRVDGGVGLAVQEPHFEVTVQKADKLEIISPNDLESCCFEVVKKLAKNLNDDKFRITIQTDTEAHVGLGSGTQCSLTLGLALCKLVGLTSMSSNQLAGLLGRGGTSGIGVHAFAHGGFIVDGGRSWPNEKSMFGPSSAFSFQTTPPLIVRMTFPNWGVCIVLPDSTYRISGSIEHLLFEKLTPIPPQEVDRACRLVLLGMLPTIATNDFDGFCESLEEFRNVGFKKREIDSADEKTRLCISMLEKLGFRGVGMSSWGPAVFGFVSSLEKANILAYSLKNNPNIRQVFTTEACNQGAFSINPY